MPAPVIVVHNEDEPRTAAINALQAAGYECAGFADPMAALDAIEENSRVRVLVTRVDFGEGRLNGIALARMMLIKRADVRTVFIARAMFEPHAEGVGTFLPVPLDPSALRRPPCKQSARTIRRPPRPRSTMTLEWEMASG